jgi:diacylglycerol O-acyltransferase
MRPLGALGSAITEPRQTLARAAELGAAFRSMGSLLLMSGRLVSIEGSLGPHRRWAVARSSLADVKVIRNAFGGSVNDVVLAVITGAFRSLLLERGDSLDDIGLRTLVPVSMRRSDDHAVNNQVSPMIAELPVAIVDPRARLDAVCDEMSELKSAHQNLAGGAVFAAAEMVPPMLVALGARVIMGVLRRSPQRFINTVTTNVPGPPFALYALGREMLEYLPFVPLGEGMRIGIAILSYNGKLSFGVTGDYDSAPDVERMALHLETELAALRDLAVDHHRSHARKPQRRTP